MSQNGIQENIDQLGWQFQWIFDPDGLLEGFGYSIGFDESYAHPEIILFGLERQTSKIVLSEIAEEIKNGKTYYPNKRYSDILSGGYEVMFREVMPGAFAEYLGIAMAFYQRPFRAYVMLWPDKNNILPTESDCQLTAQAEALNIIL